MDPLSDVLSLLKLQSYVSSGFDAAGDWSIGFSAHDGIKFYAVMSGRCWLCVEGLAPLLVGPGDCFLLPRGRPFRIASDPALAPVDAYSVLRPVRDGGVNVCNGGGEFFSVGGHFALAGEQAGVLLGMLPTIIHVRDEADRAVMRWCMDRMRRELREPQPGGFLVAQQLATMMLVQALRLHLAEGPGGGVGWLFALADRQMAAAIGAMHADPAHRWTLQELAALAGMSRTSFAVKFKETVGAAPMDYLARWRMLRAGDRLAHSRDPISVIALSLGYESESAFSTAFKRIMGSSPRRYGRTRRPAAAELGPPLGLVAE